MRLRACSCRWPRPARGEPNVSRGAERDQHPFAVVPRPGPTPGANLVGIPAHHGVVDGTVEPERAAQRPRRGDPPRGPEPHGRRKRPVSEPIRGLRFAPLRDDLQTLRCDLERRRRVTGAGRWCEERPRGRPPPGAPAGRCRPATPDRTPSCQEASARSQSDGDVAGRATVEPRARSTRAMRERRRRDLPPPRVALGQRRAFASPMYPSHRVRPVRDCQSIGPIVPYLGIQYRHLADRRSAFVYRTDRNGTTDSMGPRTDPHGEGENAARCSTVTGGVVVPADSLPPRCSGRSPAPGTGHGNTVPKAPMPPRYPPDGDGRTSHRQDGHGGQPGTTGASGKRRRRGPHSPSPLMRRTPASCRGSTLRNALSA